MKTRASITDKRLKRRNFPYRKLLTTDTKKQRNKLPSTLRNQLGNIKKLNLQNVDGLDGGVETLISKLHEKGSPSNTPLYTDRKSKRKLASILRNQIRDRKRRKMEKVDEAVEPLDRLSELPEPIIHHILSFLRCPRDVTRTSLLSKKWKTIWASFFSFDFDQRKFQTRGGDPNVKFITFVENTLATKLEMIHSVQKFKLYLTNANAKMSLRVNHWIVSAITKNVRELEIHVAGKKRRHCVLPNTVLASKTLTSLKLHGCQFDCQGVVDLCHLKELSIKKTYVKADNIQSFMRGCPLIEDLRLVYCTGLGCLRISNLFKLSRVELHECHGLKCVEIGLPSLRSFLYYGKKSWICKINLVGSYNLNSLTLKDPKLTDELFQDQISKCPDLEHLVLKECNLLERITILSIKLKELSLIDCKQLEEANIDAPNLFALEYAGDKIPFQSMHVTSLREVKLHMVAPGKSKYCRFLELQKFLRKFDGDEAWKLIVSSNKNVTIHEEMRRIWFSSSNDLKLELTKSSARLQDFIDSLLRMSYPKTLSLTSSSSSEFLKFLKEKILSREENPNCCRYYSKKCWLHYIVDVAVEVQEGAENGEKSQNLGQTTFKFNWKSVKLHN